LPCAIYTLLSLLLTPPLLAEVPTPLNEDLRESYSKPFWLDKAAFVHDGSVFAVGISQRSRTLTDGRLESFDRGKRELENFFNGNKLASIQVRTLDIYEEVNSDGTFNVYRLLSMLIPGEKERIEQEKVAQQARFQSELEQREKGKIEALIELERRANIEAEAKRRVEADKQKERDEIAKAWKEWYEEREWSKRSNGKWFGLIDCFLFQMDKEWKAKNPSVDCDDLEDEVKRATEKDIQQTVKRAWAEHGL
jgi:hypothetical protein